MSTKTIKTRIVNKTDTTANWDATVNFIPLKGELIIYQDEGLPTRYKIGDGKTEVKNLLFLSNQSDFDITEVLQAVYPVGAIYLSINNISPASLFGGTWERIEDTFLLAAGDTYAVGTTGGAATVTLTKEQVQHVYGDITMHSGGTATNISNTSGCFSAQITNQGKYRDGGTVGTTANSIGIVHFDNGGRGQAHNNMPPYLAVYIWKRIE